MARKDFRHLEGPPYCHQLRDWGYQFVYTPKLLHGSLEAAGFKNIRQVGIGESDDPVLKNAEDRANWPVFRFPIRTSPIGERSRSTASLRSDKRPLVPEADLEKRDARRVEVFGRLSGGVRRLQKPAHHAIQFAGP